ncbi:hypothetical protein N7466_005976 [Penicillium verhagenii]|uniref:uncharacterized protein n=1 Tax=Penicillium verhagenii TaxID=1562060 RepID=UPI002545BB15|nr:uncharacterized protein N7466_005976 [Penicillium verhagenii]KAJ5930483.1 hypothetical protein N7466_005976 [Penicillium verhagenii]
MSTQDEAKKPPISKLRQDIIDFLEEITDEAFEAFPPPISKGHKNMVTKANWRLDRQCLTSGPPPMHNLQVQGNSGIVKPKSAKRLAGQTVSMVLVPADGTCTGAEIRKALIEAIYSNI